MYGLLLACSWLITGYPLRENCPSSSSPQLSTAAVLVVKHGVHMLSPCWDFGLAYAWLHLCMLSQLLGVEMCKGLCCYCCCFTLCSLGAHHPVPKKYTQSLVFSHLFLTYSVYLLHLVLYLSLFYIPYFTSYHMACCEARWLAPVVPLSFFFDCSSIFSSQMSRIYSLCQPALPILPPA